jgi:hypothetical protein
MKGYKVYWWIIIAIFVVVILANRSAKQAQQTAIEAELLPGISTFLGQQKADFGGTVDGVTEMPDWANGPRQQVQLGSISYLFYLQDNEVVTVYRYNFNGSREEVWRK